MEQVLNSIKKANFRFGFSLTLLTSAIFLYKAFEWIRNAISWYLKSGRWDTFYYDIPTIWYHNKLVIIALMIGCTYNFVTNNKMFIFSLRD